MALSRSNPHIRATAALAVLLAMLPVLVALATPELLTADVYQAQYGPRAHLRLRAIAAGQLTGGAAEDLLVGSNAGSVFVVADGGTRTPREGSLTYQSELALGTGHKAIATGYVTRRRDDGGDAQMIAGGSDRVLIGDVSTPIDQMRVYESPGSTSFGEALAVADVQPDGYDDVWIGDPGAGRVYLVVGSAAPHAQLIFPDDGSADVTLVGAGIGGVIATGDVTGDGAPDLLVSAPSVGAGVVYLIKGHRRLRDVMLLPEDADAVFTGISAGDLAGASIKTLDLDGDGTSDIVIGANGVGVYELAPRRTNGETYVLWGGPTLASRSLADADVTFRQEARGFGGWGFAHAVGDLNRDGYDDLVILAPQEGGHAYYGRPRHFFPRVVTAVDRNYGWISSLGGRRYIAQGIVLDRGGDGRDLVLSGEEFNNVFIGAGGADYFETGGLLFYQGSRAGTLWTDTTAIARTVAVGTTASAVVTLPTSGSMPVSWRVDLQKDVAGGWVSVSTATGTSAPGSPAGFQVNFVSEAGMALRTYTATITIVPDGQPEQHWITIPVSFTVTEPPPPTPPPPSPGSVLQLLLRNASTGELEQWAMNGAMRTAAYPLDPPAVSDMTWQVVGTGDFNADGQPDVVWQEQTRGDIGVWLMNGPTRLRFEPFTPVSTVADLGWKIVAIADINNDTKPDLVWREEHQGWLAAWLMDGTTRVANVALNPGTVDVEWEITGAGDFNGDGRTDLLWRQRDAGYLAVWLMNGVTRLSAVALSPGQVADTDWRVAATGDVDGDGWTDVIWQHQARGWLVAWLMHGTSLTSNVMLTPSTLAPSWEIRGASRIAPAGPGSIVR